MSPNEIQICIDLIYFGWSIRNSSIKFKNWYRPPWNACDPFSFHPLNAGNLTSHNTNGRIMQIVRTTNSSAKNTRAMTKLGIKSATLFLNLGAFQNLVYSQWKVAFRNTEWHEVIRRGHQSRRFPIQHSRNIAWNSSKQVNLLLKNALPPCHSCETWAIFLKPSFMVQHEVSRNFSYKILRNSYFSPLFTLGSAVLRFLIWAARFLILREHGCILYLYRWYALHHASKNYADCARDSSEQTERNRWIKIGLYEIS